MLQKSRISAVGHGPQSVISKRQHRCTLNYVWKKEKKNHGRRHRPVLARNFSNTCLVTKPVLEG